VTLADFGYHVNALAPKEVLELQYIWFSNHLTWSVRDEGCYRNSPCT